MKILLDHNLDRRLKNSLLEFDVFTTQEQNWSNALNGELISLLETNGFNVLITADANIKDQQNITNRSISILIIRAFNNRLKTHAEMIEQIKMALSAIQSGEILEVFHDDMNNAD